MGISKEDIISTIRICLASVENQRKNQTSDVMNSYLDGYAAACKIILELVQKKIEAIDRVEATAKEERNKTE